MNIYRSFENEEAVKIVSRFFKHNKRGSHEHPFLLDEENLKKSFDDELEKI